MKFFVFGTAILTLTFLASRNFTFRNQLAVASETQEGRKIAAPEFTGITSWVNSKPLKIANQKGKVVVLHFWTYSCINCVHNYPHYRAWIEKYGENKEFTMIGVHTPEFDSDKSVERITDRAKKNKLTFPIAVDNDSATWKAWGNQYWPSVYLIDKSGIVRKNWSGELGEAGFKTMTAEIDSLLKEAAN